MAAAAILGVPFAIYVAVAQVVAPPTRAEWAAADPILRLLPEGIAAWGPPVVGLVAAATWWRVAQPDRATSRRGLLEGLGGAAIATSLVLALRLAVGEQMPAFIPTEESARPGLGLSMGAGYLEEVAIRMTILPALFFGLRGRARAAPLIAVVLTGATFAAWHALGEATFSLPYFVTRFVVPGCAMSAAWLVSPSAIVVGHCAAHLWIPVLFT